MKKNNQSHPIYKLGKAQAKKDTNSLLFSSLVNKKISIPEEYDFDIEHRGIPVPMFANDEYGCCVISGRAHQTLRFELLEKGSKLLISDSNVIDEYLKESDGVDRGLVVRDSLLEWQNKGWIVAEKLYKIRAFSDVLPTDIVSMKQAIFLDLGLGMGIKLPLSAQDQFQAGKPWDTKTGAGSKAGSWGGHYVYVCGYTSLGPVCVTWGQKQQMTWEFVAKYCDEAFAIFDAKDSKKTLKHINFKSIIQHLAKSLLK